MINGPQKYERKDPRPDLPYENDIEEQPCWVTSLILALAVITGFTIGALWEFF